MLATLYRAFDPVLARLAGTPERIAIAAEPPRRLRITLFGLCQFEALIGAVGKTPHRLRHVLMASFAGADVPAAADDDDCAVFALSLRPLLIDACDGARPGADLVFARQPGPEEVAALLDRVRALIAAKLAAIAAVHRDRPAFFLTFFEPNHTALGDLADPYAANTPREIIRALNRILVTELHAYAHFHPIEVNALLNDVGRRYLCDDMVLHDTHASFISVWSYKLDSRRLGRLSQWRRALRFELALRRFAGSFIDHLERLYRIATQGQTIKLIVVDLDDTMWRGIPAEEDDEGLPIDQRIEGWPLGLAEALLMYKARGGILAICSKNDHSATAERFDRIYRGALTLDDFAAIRINWKSKAQNISEILSETNILPQNALFIDDNPRELAEVKAAHPLLHCLGTDFYNWRAAVLHAAETQTARITDESRRRTGLVRAAAVRAAAGADPVAAEDRAGWLARLGLRQRVRVVGTDHGRLHERAFELLNKTNQFNTTGRKWSASEFANFLETGGVCLVSDVRDTIADNGIVAVCLVRDDEIVQLALSCRVFGLGVETVMAAAAVGRILKHHARAVGRVVDSGRNAACHDFFQRIGFVAEGERSVIDRPVEVPAHISVSWAF